MQQNQIPVPEYGEAVENGNILEKDGWHKPTPNGVRDRRPACGCKPADGNKGAYRDVSVEMDDGGRHVVHFYHQSPVVVYHRGRYRLSSCGWQTRTTKERINRYNPSGYRVVQRDFDWYLETPDGERVEFADGMVLDVR